MKGREKCKPDDILFTLPNESGDWVPMSKAIYVKWFRHRLSQMKLNPLDYKLHGYRHGGLHQLLQAEGSLHKVKILSNHLSSSVYAYSELPADKRMVTARKMLESLASDINDVSASIPLNRA